jgi:AAA+ ATPase superfamily predicted ATPase
MIPQKPSGNFIGRHKELLALKQMYESPSSVLVPIYGRRRVGKSELILQFLKKKQGVYFLGKQASAELQKQEFLLEIAQVLQEPLLPALASESWKKILYSITEKIRGSKKFILVFDEFQWTVKTSPELPSVLQDIWDNVWSKNHKMFLILCGSYVGFMEREVLGAKSPLYGRRTGQIFLKPMDYQQAAEFHPNYSFVDQARVYFLCGGIPLYLKNFQQELSIETNLMINFLNEFAPLFREADFLLREELNEVERYYAILTSLADRTKALLQIAKEMHLDERKLYYYLQNLVELGYVRRKYPLSLGYPLKRSVRFELSDPLLKFWFRFIYPHMSAIVYLGQERAFKDKIAPVLESYFGSCFEKLCKEALVNLYRKEHVVTEFEIGEYWDKKVQIDLVGHRKDGIIDLGECKWGQIHSVASVIQDLNRKISLYPNPANASIRSHIFLKKKLQIPRTRSIAFHTLEELYKL